MTLLSPVGLCAKLLVCYSIFVVIVSLFIIINMHNLCDNFCDSDSAYCTFCSWLVHFSFSYV